jgi:alpha-tubulin suppressor-like RCC1 family protein
MGWGHNDFGQSTPPPGLTNAIAVAAGAGHSLVLIRDGSVVAWGLNNKGQAIVPEGLSDVVAVSAGFDFALRGDGTVIAWGGENYYQQTNVPPGLAGVVAVAAGAGQSVALRADGRLVVWGWYAPPPPNTLSHVVAISAGSRYTLALVDPEYYPQLIIRREPASVALSWTGGRGPFQVLQRTNLFLPEEWENVGEPVTTNVVLLPLGPDNRFLRVLDLAPRR